MNAITILACIIAGGGFLCFLIWVKLIGEASKLRNLKRFRSKNAGVADLLNYATMVDDGIIACKSGALMAAWVYTGKDNAQKTEAELNQTSDLLNRALLPLDDGWMLHVDNVRHEAPRYPERNRSHFPDPVSAAVDEERRRLFETQGIMYEGHFVLTVTWLPPLLAERKAVELMFDDDRKPDSKPRQFSILLDSFKKNVRALEERLSTTLTLHRLQTQAYEREDGITEYYDSSISNAALPASLTLSICLPVRIIWTFSLADRNSGAAPSQRWDVNSSRSSPSRAFRPCPHRESSLPWRNWISNIAGPPDSSFWGSRRLLHIFRSIAGNGGKSSTASRTSFPGV